jgi:hypothetical protein
LPDKDLNDPGHEFSNTLVSFPKTMLAPRAINQQAKTQGQAYHKLGADTRGVGNIFWKICLQFGSKDEEKIN